MNFNAGDRVVATASIGSIPPGSRGTVKTVGASTCGVVFDIRPTNVVVAPKSKLRRVSGAKSVAAAGVFAAMSPDDAAGELPTGLVWFPPRVFAPSVGSSDDVIATPNAGTLTILFDDASVELRRHRRSGAWFGAAEFPIEGGPAKVRGQLRGGAVQGKDAHAVIVVTIGAATRVIELQGEQNREITEDLTAIIDAPQDIVTVAVSVVATRQSDDETLIVVDSIDLVGA